jgi:hypothetical protein
MSKLYYVSGYLALLVPSLAIAVNRWWDIADPPTLEIPASFWLSTLGQWVWFGSAFALPALLLCGLGFAFRLIRKLNAKYFHAAVNA